jgi:hypothetical protein
LSHAQIRIFGGDGGAGLTSPAGHTSNPMLHDPILPVDKLVTVKNLGLRGPTLSLELDATHEFNSSQ